MTNMGNETMRLPEVARRLGITTSEVYELVGTERLAVERDDNGWRVVRSDVVEEFARQRA